MGLFKNLRRGYRGGPDFAHCEQITRLLENWQLQLTVPCTNVAAAPSKFLPQYPFKQPGWYEEHSKADIFIDKTYIHLNTELWYYVRPLTLHPENFNNQHTLSVQLRRIDSEPPVDIFDLEQLGDFFCAQYERNYAKKLNPRLEEDRSTTLKYKPRTTEEEMQEIIERRFGSLLRPPASSFTVQHFNKEPWLVFYEPEHRLYNRPENVYVRPLEDNFVVCMRFRHEIGARKLHKKTEPVMLDTERRIMESVSLKKEIIDKIHDKL